jgi:hypothetical protein
MHDDVSNRDIIIHFKRVGNVQVKGDYKYAVYKDSLHRTFYCVSTILHPMAIYYEVMLFEEFVKLYPESFHIGFRWR